MKTTKEYIYIIVGTTILALGISFFYETHNLVTGGVVGLGIIINSVSKQNFGLELPLWLTNLALNLPIFVTAVIVKGRRFAAKSFFATIYLSLALYATSFLHIPKYDLLLSSIYGGVLSGVGLGLVFQAYATTGGTDMVASTINHFFRETTISRILFYIDGFIIAMGFWIFGFEKGLNAMIAVFVTMKVIDSMMEGVNFATAVYIISNKSDEIGKAIIEKLERGVTALKGRGVYSNKEKEVLMCIVGKRQVFKVKDIIQEVDPDAFVVVYDAREVLGEGFTGVVKHNGVKLNPKH